LPVILSKILLPLLPSPIPPTRAPPALRDEILIKFLRFIEVDIKYLLAENGISIIQQTNKSMYVHVNKNANNIYVTFVKMIRKNYCGIGHIVVCVIFRQ
jgi:hypothetical protein